MTTAARSKTTRQKKTSKAKGRTWDVWVTDDGAVYFTFTEADGAIKGYECLPTADALQALKNVVRMAAKMAKAKAK